MSFKKRFPKFSNLKDSIECKLYDLALGDYFLKDGIMYRLEFKHHKLQGIFNVYYFQFRELSGHKLHETFLNRTVTYLQF